MDFLNGVKAGQNPLDLAFKVASEHLPVPIRLSRGQMTGSPADQLAENTALRGGSGPQAEQTARSFQQGQQEGLAANVGAIKDRIAGGSLRPGQGGEMVSNDLNTAYTAKKGQVDAAYDAARNGAPTELPAYDAQALSGNVRGAVADYDPLNIPRVARELDRLNALASGQADPNLKDLFDARSRLSKLRSSADPVEAGAAGKAVKQFDSEIDDAVSNSLFQGDPGAVALWKDAIAERREFGQLFQGNDLIQKLTAREPRSGMMQLTVDPKDATNYILGRSDLGAVGRANLYRDLNNLRMRLGPQSNSWRALQAEMFQRFANTGDSGVEGGVRQFSGVKFLKAWQGAKGDDPQLINLMFSPDQRATIDQFAGVAARVTNPVRGGDNSSNSAITMARLLKRLPFMAGRYIPFAATVAKNLDEDLAAAATRRATYGARPRMTLPNTGSTAGYLTGGAIAAVAGRGGR